MGTIYNFDEEMASVTTVLQPTDKLCVHEGASSVKKVVTGNQIAGVGMPIVNTTATLLTVTQAAHAGSMIVISSTSPIAITLPAATATGMKLTFAVNVSATATSHTITHAGTDVFQGQAIFQTTSNTCLIWTCTATDNVVTMNGSTLGGLVGDIVELVDIKAGVWQVKMRSSSTGAAATPFSHS